MRKTIFILKTLVVAFAIVFILSPVMADVKIKDISSRDFENEVLRSDTPVIVFFQTYYCKPCTKLVSLWDVVSGLHRDKVKFVSIDVYKNRDIANRFSIKAIPTIIFFKGGRAVDAITGFIVDEKKIVEKIKDFAGLPTTVTEDVNVQKPEIFVKQWLANSVYSVSFSPDSRYALSGNKLWDIMAGQGIMASAGLFSPDGKYILWLNEERHYYVDKDSNFFKLLEAPTGKELKTFKGHIFNISAIAFSPDGRYALSGDVAGIIKLWDIFTGMEIKTFTFKEYTETGKARIELVVPPSKGEIKREIEKLHGIEGVLVSNVAKGSLAEQMDIRKNDVIVSINDKKITGPSEARDIVAALSPMDKVNIIVIRDRQKLSKTGYMLEGKGGLGVMIQPFTGGMIRTETPASVKSLTFSPDGKFALSINARGILKLWNITTGEEIKTAERHSGVGSAAFSPDGKHVLSGRAGGMELWDIADGRMVKKFKGHAINPIWTVVFSPDGRYALSGSIDKTIKLWDIEMGKEIRTFAGHLYGIASVAFSPDGKHILSAGQDDGTARLWDITTGREIAKFVGFKDGEWIVIVPEGYYNSSLNGHKYLNIRMGNNVYGIDQFYDVFYRPDIVTSKLRGEDISSLITLTIDDAIKNPPPSVEITSIPKNVNQLKVKVCYQAKSTGGGIGEVRVFHNGKLVHSDGFYKDIAKSDSPKQLAALSGKAIYAEVRGIKITAKGESSPIESKSKGEAYEDCKEIDAVPGENEVSVAAFNSQNTVQSYMKTASFNANLKGEEPHLYILSIGVDQYKDRNINLKYAVKDATDMKEKIFKQSATLYKPENIHFETITDETAVKRNIIGRIDAISQKIKPTDSFILFVAGHGVLLQNQYYMLTHDFDGTVSEGSLISSNEIVEMSKKIKSLSQLFIFDTCHAGGVDYIVSGLYDARMSVLAKKMGLHIYASANSIQQAMDGYHGNGLFTYTLLDGLNNKKEADKNKDNRISLVELGEYSKTKTIETSKSIGHAQTPLIINFGKDNPVYNLR